MNNKQQSQIFNNDGTPVDFQATKGKNVTPSDTVILSPGSLYVGTGGNINVVLVNDSSPILFTNVQDGTFMPIKVKQIYSTDTTASDIKILR